MSPRALATLLLALSLTACASAPPAPPAAKPAAAEQIQTIDLLCAEGARYLSYDKLGVPEGESPEDVAVTRGSVWVLFPQRLVQISRRSDHVEVRMQISPPGETWAKIDADPVDESVWVASQSRPVLFKVTSGGQMTVVKIPKVEGKGGFSGLMVARDAIYAQPTCADAAVWRVDRSGKVLATAFPAPKRADDEPEEMLEAGQARMRCLFMRLDRDADGHLLAWNLKDRTTWQVDGEGAWTPSASHLFEHLPGEASALVVKGVAVGEKSEHWYVGNSVGKLFFWKGKPVFLGTYANRERSVGVDTLLHLPSDTSDREVLMTCHKASVREVATDATGYAAITERFLVL